METRLSGNVVGAHPDEPSIATAGVVHDLGNLIQIATSALNILARAPDMPATPMLDRARACLDHAGTLVRQNLAPQRDRTDAEERCSLRTVLAELATLVAAMGGSRLALDLSVDPHLPPLRCDAEGLRRALLNLVLNACDAMTGDGVVRIEAGPAPGVAALAEIRVVDRGRGMTPALLARAFDPAFTTKPGGQGGIGLPTVGRFVRAAGGTIGIHSTPGAGTTVTLRLPLARQLEEIVR